MTPFSHPGRFAKPQELENNAFSLGIRNVSRWRFTMTTRSFFAGATVALLPLAEAPAFAQPASGDARLNALFDEIFQERVRNSPETGRYIDHIWSLIRDEAAQAIVEEAA